MTTQRNEVALPVAFCSDLAMEAPLHVAMSSLLRNLAEGYCARFYLILEGFSADQIHSLRRTLDKTGRRYELRILEGVRTEVFAGFRPHAGSLATYYRLLLPDLVQEEKLLYLDADLSVEADVSPLFASQMGGMAAGFVVDRIVKRQWDGAFLMAHGKKPDDPAFNAGVMLLNLPEWRRQGISARFFAFGQETVAALPSCDQTLLNLVFGSNCFDLGREFNVRVYCTAAPGSTPARGILHYIGSPKPWDLGGRLLLPHARRWYQAVNQTALPWRAKVPWLQTHSWQRLPKIAGGYWRVLRAKYRRLRQTDQKA